LVSVPGARERRFRKNSAGLRWPCALLRKVT
jgi:hypothetical protein